MFRLALPSWTEHGIQRMELMCLLLYSQLPNVHPTTTNVDGRDGSLFESPNPATPDRFLHTNRGCENLWRSAKPLPHLPALLKLKEWRACVDEFLAFDRCGRTRSRTLWNELRLSNSWDHTTNLDYTFNNWQADWMAMHMDNRKVATFEGNKNTGTEIFAEVCCW